MHIQFHWPGPMRTGRPLKPRTQFVIIGIIVAGAIIFFSLSPFQTISNIESRVTEEVTIVTSSNSLCQINTNDDMAPTKMISNCKLDEGAKATVSYRKGMPFAKIMSP